MYHARTAQAHACLCGLLFALSLVTGTAAAQAPGAVSVTLHAPKAQYRSYDLIPFAVSVHSVHPQRRVALRGVPSFAENGGLELVVIHPDGHREVAPHAAEVVPEEEVRSGARAVLLAPGEGVAVYRRDLAGELFPSPGTYRVVVSYTSPLPEQAGGDDAPVEGASAISNELELEIAE